VINEDHITKSNIMKIILTDTFNDRVISNHRSVKAAVAKRIAHLRAIKKANGASSYLTYSITAADGSDIREEVEAEEIDQQCR
jgi:hypothetical protein